MPDIISLPSSIENVSGPDINNNDLCYLNGQFGYFETTNSKHRRTQEDALTRVELTEKDLTSSGASASLTPVQIGHRLWTSYQALDTPDLIAGTTASTTVYDGKGNLITATLADAAAFAVAYNKEGEALGVVRLNSITHKPTEEKELQRITQAGGFVIMDRVLGLLAVSRAIGDINYDLKSNGVCSESSIDITNINKIINELNKNPDEIGSIQIITTCDGFTDGAGSDDKKDQEDYLLNKLKAIENPGKRNPIQLAEHLVEEAKKDHSTDNISVAIQNITNETAPFLLGVYDGHGGTGASIKAATSIGGEFKKQCALTQETYAQQELSTTAQKANYERDNKDENTPPQQTSLQTEGSILSLDLKATTNQTPRTTTAEASPSAKDGAKVWPESNAPEQIAEHTPTNLTNSISSANPPRIQAEAEALIIDKNLSGASTKTILNTLTHPKTTTQKSKNMRQGTEHLLETKTPQTNLPDAMQISEKNRDFFFVHKTKSVKVLDNVKDNLFNNPKPGKG